MQPFDRRWPGTVRQMPTTDDSDTSSYSSGSYSGTFVIIVSNDVAQKNSDLPTQLMSCKCVEDILLFVYFL